MRPSLPAGTRFVVHIGRHKTGTSSLQRALNSQASELADGGYYYPKAGRDPNGVGRSTMIAHHRLATELATGQPGPIAEELRSEVSAVGEVIVISSEALQNLAGANLAALFPPDETVIVTYLREQVAYLLSAYAQRVQANDYYASIEQYVEAHLKQLNYIPGLDGLVATYGPERVIARAYDGAYLVGGSTVADFYAILGIDLRPPDGDGNPSINANTVLVKRLMSLCGTTLPEGLYNKLPALSDRLGGARSVALSAERQAEIRGLYVEANRELFDRFVGVPNGSFTMKDHSRDETLYTQDEVIALVEAAFDELNLR